MKLDSNQPALTAEAEQLAWLQHGLRVFGGEEVADTNRSCGHCLVTSADIVLPSDAEIAKVLPS